MDDRKAILNLSTYFPTKSEDYLRAMYRKHNYEMVTTIKAIHDDRPKKKNWLGRFFNQVRKRFSRHPKISENRQPGSSRQNEIFFEAYIGKELVKQLEEKFGDPSLTLPKEFQPVIEIPVVLARQLYVAYVESVYRQQEEGDHDQIIDQLDKEDEEFAWKLQRRDQKSESIITLETDLENDDDEAAQKEKRMPKLHLEGNSDQLVNEHTELDTKLQNNEQLHEECEEFNWRLRKCGQNVKSVVFRQQEGGDHDQIADQLDEEDEEFARKLQRRDQKSESIITLETDLENDDDEAAQKEKRMPKLHLKGNSDQLVNEHIELDTKLQNNEQLHEESEEFNWRLRKRGQNIKSVNRTDYEDKEVQRENNISKSCLENNSDQRRLVDKSKELIQKLQNINQKCLKKRTDAFEKWSKKEHPQFKGSSVPKLHEYALNKVMIENEKFLNLSEKKSAKTEDSETSHVTLEENLFDLMIRKTEKKQHNNEQKFLKTETDDFGKWSEEEILEFKLQEYALNKVIIKNEKFLNTLEEKTENIEDFKTSQVFLEKKVFDTTIKEVEGFTKSSKVEDTMPTTSILKIYQNHQPDQLKTKTEKLIENQKEENHVDINAIEESGLDEPNKENTKYQFDKVKRREDKDNQIKKITTKRKKKKSNILNQQIDETDQNKKFNSNESLNITTRRKKKKRNTFIRTRPYVVASSQNRYLSTESINSLEAETSETLKTSRSDVSVNDLKEDKTDCVVEINTATYYRKQAQQHLKERENLYQKAQYHLTKNERKLAHYYFQEAKKQRDLYEHINRIAAITFLEENRKRNPTEDTIDLHNLFVKEAIEALDVFLDSKIRSLEYESQNTKSLMVITGRGKHSYRGIPRIKPAVIQRLKKRSLRYSEINPGLLKIHIGQYSSLSTEL